MSVVHFHLGKVDADGKPALTAWDIQQALDARYTGQPDAVAQIRRLTGDTDSTIVQVKINNAAWHALCDKPGDQP
jgi:hypothetical protein